MATSLSSSAPVAGPGARCPPAPRAPLPTSVQMMSIAGVAYRPLPQAAPITELQMAYNPVTLTPAV